MHLLAPEPFLSDTGRILKEIWGADVRVTSADVLKDGARCRVVRCAVANAPSGVLSVIVKQIKAQPERGFDEWASLAFLSALPNARDIVPRFYGGDETNRLFVMEDFGGGQTLDDLLNGSDKDAARAALGDLARQMARLHTTRWQRAIPSTNYALPFPKPKAHNGSMKPNAGEVGKAKFGTGSRQ